MSVGWSKLVAAGRIVIGAPTARTCRAVGLAVVLSLSLSGLTAANAQEAFLEVEPQRLAPPPPVASTPTAAPAVAKSVQKAGIVKKKSIKTGGSRTNNNGSTLPPPPKYEADVERLKVDLAIKQQEAWTAWLNADVERANKKLEAETKIRKEQADADINRARLGWVLILVFCGIAGFTILSGLLFHWLSRKLAVRKYSIVGVPGSDEDATNRDIPYTRLPLGLPDGSIRAIISLFIVIIGFLILAFQKALMLDSAEAISGFIGAIISFYFATRNEAANREDAAAATQAASAANTALQNASTEAIKTAAASSTKQNEVITAQFDKMLAGLTPNSGQSTGQSTAGVPQAALSLQTLSTDLQHVRQLASAVSAIPVGTGPVSGAADVMQRIDTMLATVQPLLSGTADPATTAMVAAQADALLRDVTHDNPVVSTITGALATVAKAATDNGVVGQILTGIGGPVGLVGSLLFSGIKLFADQRQFEAWKKAVLAQPFDIDALSLSPDDPTLPEAAAALSPLVTIIGNLPPMIRELYRISIVAPGQTPKTAEELATESATANTALFHAFGSDAKVLADAITEYRTILVSLVAANALPSQLPGDPASTTSTIASNDLVRAVGTVRQEPGAAGALDQLISVVEALAKNALGTDLSPLLSGAITVAKDLLQSEPVSNQQ